MPEQAQITSVAALESFRADLIVFLGQMRPLLDEIGGEVVRLRFWLENEQRELWENEARRRRRRLEEAQAELFNARLSPLHDSSAIQHMAEHRARLAVEEAEQKLRALKKWGRELENLTSPMLKPVGQLQGFLAADLPRAVTHLTQTIQALAAYLNVTPPETPPPTESATDDTPPSASPTS